MYRARINSSGRCDEATEQGSYVLVEYPARLRNRMKVSVPKEVAEGERRVALVPEVAKRLSPTGIEMAVESGAGEAAHHPDSAYEEAGVSVSADAGLSGDVIA